MNDERRLNTPAEILEVVQGHVDGCIVQIRLIESLHSEWLDGSNPKWDFTRFQYRIKPAEQKRVKLCCFVYTDGAALWIEEGSCTYNAKRNSGRWTRRPEFDMEAEVAE